MKIISVVGARPNFMKIAPLVRELKKDKTVRHTLVHTGQHYDRKMSHLFFHELGIPKPDINLEVGSGSHAVQTAQVMTGFEQVVLKKKPDLVVVVGDVNSTIACSLVAVKLGIPVAHIEAGLRSRDRNMPEEINRVLTDQISDLLFTTCREAGENLRAEGIDRGKIHFTGNIMIDTLKDHLKRAGRSGILEREGLEKKGYALVTLHRPSNVDDKTVFNGILDALQGVQEYLPVFFPVHPRTRKNILKFTSPSRLKKMGNLIFSEPAGYFDFMNLMMNARLVLTDSGGIQEETTVLGVPCLTVRENTERPITITEGTNVLVGTSPDKILREAKKVIKGEAKKGRCPKYWDGKTAQRIVAVIKKWGKQ